MDPVGALPNFLGQDATPGRVRSAYTDADYARRQQLKRTWDSEGSIHITSTDPDAPLDIEANYLATEHDSMVSVDAFRGLRRVFDAGALAKRIERETVPDAERSPTRRSSTPD